MLFPKRYKFAYILAIFIVVALSFFAGWERGKERVINEIQRTQEELISVPRERRAPSWKKIQSEDGRAIIAFSRNKKFISILTKILDGHTPQDWEEELNVIQKNSDSSSLECALRIYFCQWAEIDFSSALERACKLGWLSQSVKEGIFSQLAGKDPLKALSYYEQYKETLRLEKRCIMREIARNWASMNEEQAWEWCSSLGKEEQGNVIPYFIRGLDWKEGKVEKYLAFATKNSHSSSFDLVRDWAIFAPEAAWKWACSETSHFSDSYKREVLSSMAMVDMDKALDTFNQIPQEQQFIYIQSIALAMEDGEKALSWVLEKISSSKISRKDLSPLGKWVEEYPTAAKNWINKQDSPQLRELATEIYAEKTFSPHQYDDALSLIEKIQDEGGKQRILRESLSRWERESPESFARWLDKSQYSHLTQEGEEKKNRNR